MLTTQQLVEYLLSPYSKGRRYIFGRNEHAIELSKAIECDGFIDDYSSEALWCSKPVIKGDKTPQGCVIINSVLQARPITAAIRIQELNPLGVLSYSDLLSCLPIKVSVPQFVEDTTIDIKENSDKWNMLSSSLDDSESKQVLSDVVNYRLTCNYKYMANYGFRPKEQYFEQFLGLPDGVVFVDAGGYEGETTEEFARQYPAYRKVFLYEPSPISIDKARTRLDKLRNIEFVEKGLSDTTGTVQFNLENGPANTISENGTCTIHVTTLDADVTEKVSFIKMDLEGWELEALKGSKKHIIEDRPRLAIAVYHHPSDFWKICEFVKNVRSDYKVYLRHYTEGWTETVMFFV